jgi:outer membrane biosynthesis protein TonB
LTYSQALNLDPASTHHFQPEPSLEWFDKPAQPACLDERRIGRLPAEVIRESVRGHYEKFTRCYEAGLAGNPRLKGRVTVRFAIARDGKIENIAVINNELPDCAVVRCIRDGFGELAFPPPEQGIVTVIYPIQFEPAAAPPSNDSSARPLSP